MLEGLEAIELSCAQVFANNDVFRFDPEYFDKEALAAVYRLTSFGAVPFSSVAFVTDGIHESLPFVEDGLVRILSAKHPKDNFVDRAGFEMISTEYHERNPRTALRAGDVLLSTVGTIGNSAVVTPDLLPANCDRHVGIIRPNKADLSPYFVSTFLVCRYGRLQSLREATGNVQLNLFISKIGEMLLPRFSAACEERISSVVIQAYRTRETAAGKLLAAEQILLRALDLENWQPPEPLTYTRSSRDAFTADRVDAEYFYPAKQAALDKLAALPGRAVGEMFDSARDLWQPEAAPPNTLVRNYDLTDALNPFLDDTIEAVNPGLIASTKKRIRKGDLVVSRLRSYLREIAVVLGNGEIPMVASTEFIVLRPKAHSMRVEALLVYLRSTLPQLIFKWSQDGSNHPRFDEKELLNLRVPDVVITKQDQLADMLDTAIRSRRRATELLDAAKHAVEIAIESSEATALKFLNKTLETPPE